MYADRYAQPSGIKPGSLAMALAISGAMIGALMFSQPEVVQRIFHPPLKVIDVDLPPPPPPPQPQPRTQAPQPRNTVILPPPPVPVPPTSNPITAVDIPLPPPPVPIEGSGPVATATPAPPPAAALPALVDPSVDPRYADALQPEYPPEERRAGHEGRVTVRVLIGANGRVEQVERVTADSDAFFEATRRQAMAHWRFRPGTRGGVPVEAWRTMSIRFVLQDAE